MLTGFWKNGSSRASSTPSATASMATPFSSPTTTATVPAVCCISDHSAMSLKKRELQYTPHYTEQYMGHRQRLLVDAQAGVYRYDELIVLRDTDMLPSCSKLVRSSTARRSCGSDGRRQALVSAAVTDAVEAFCAGRRPRASINVASRAGKVSRQATAPATPGRTMKQR